MLPIFEDCLYFADFVTLNFFSHQDEHGQSGFHVALRDQLQRQQIQQRHSNHHINNDTINNNIIKYDNNTDDNNVVRNCNTINNFNNRDSGLRGTSFQINCSLKL